MKTVLRQLLCEHVATQRQIGRDSLDSHVLLHAATTAQAATTRFLTRCAHMRSYAEAGPRCTGVSRTQTPHQNVMHCHHQVLDKLPSFKAAV